MDIWTILTIVSIPPTVAYYGVKWHRARLAKRREEIVRRVQSIPLERAVYRLHAGGTIPLGTPAPVVPSSGYDLYRPDCKLSAAQIEDLKHGPFCEKCGGTHVQLRNGGDCMGRRPRGMMG